MSQRAFATSALAAGALALASCGSNASPAATPTAPMSAGLQLVLDHPAAPATDTIEVFVCAVPEQTTDPVYGTMTLRLTLDPMLVATELEAGVTPYFAELSHRAYVPHFVAGSTLTMAPDELHDHCVDRALDASRPDATVVLAVATAEHLGTEPGGWGRPGAACPTGACPASVTRRAAYVGASDFHPDNGTTPLLDLVEHEIGHTLGLPHSGDAGDDHASALDMMSNSAAPRDVQPGRRDAQDTLAIDRLALGWLPESAVTVAGPMGGTYDLAPSAGTSGPRLLVLPLDELTFVTVEYLAAAGLDDFLPSSGLAVHRIDQSPSACGRTSPNPPPCTGVDRRQITLGSDSPHTDLLSSPGQTWHLEGWDITVRRAPTTANPTMQLAVTPTDR